MSAQPIIEDNLQALESGARLLKLLSDEQYNRVFSPYFSSSIGKHFRHILDHYLSLLSGLTDCHVNYDRRDRDERLESDPHYALQTVTQIQEALLRISRDQPSNNPLDRVIDVTLCTSSNGPDAPPVGSTVQRELVFLQGHTTHHYAIIAAILKLLEIPVDDRFGVAPSTLKHEGQSQCVQ